MSTDRQPPQLTRDGPPRRVRTCPVAGCAGSHPRHHLMCRRCWNALPKPLRDDLWRSYRECGVMSDEYLIAREHCIAHAEGRAPDPEFLAAHTDGS